MKISYMSDLHFEFSEIMPAQAEAKLPGGDVLVLAGDIAPWKGIRNDRYKNLPKFLEIAANKYKCMLAVAGNHEFYGGDLLDHQDLQDWYKSHGVTMLENESYEFGGKTFFGATFWTDMNDADPEVMKFAPTYMNDYHIIKGLDPTTQIEKFRRSVNALKQANADIVISHHAPGAGSIDPRYRHEPRANFLYYSDIQIPDSVTHWFHGHVHTRTAYRKDGCQVRANPRGYPGETGRNGFSFDAQVEVA